MVAPDRKVDPLIVTVIVPTESGFGDTEVMVGPDASMLTYVRPETFLLTALDATICTGFCPGRLAGAV